MKQRYIEIRGAREHNLKNIDVNIPKNKLVVITGLSGSGKSTLAFDTLYAEGQRRYVESLSSYARQFLNLMPKPDVDKIDGLSPAISIEQKTISKNPRSTVGTITEIYDYLRLLYAGIGVPYSPTTGLPIKAQTISQIVDSVAALPVGKYYLLSPIARERKGEFRGELMLMKKLGFERVFVDKTLYRIDEVPHLSKNVKHNISVVVDRISLSSDEVDIDDLKHRLANSVDIALKQSNGLLIVKHFDTNEEKVFSENFACPVSGFCIEKIERRLFSFNSPKGACKACYGLGFKNGFSGNIGNFRRTPQMDDSEPEDDLFIEKEICPVCGGTRLSKEALCIKINEKNIAEVSDMPIDIAKEWIKNLKDNLNEKDLAISEKILKEIQDRLQFLVDVGLNYLTLSRASETLSGGESQRIRLASQIGSGLTGIMYVLDEPSIGLHQRDNDRLIRTLKELRDHDNTVIVVEHDEDAMHAADWIIDVGPKAGIHGGEICAEGNVDDLKKNPNSLTGQYLAGIKSIELPKQRRRINSQNTIELVDAHANNLKHLNVKFPLGVFVCVTGVSGSGKSTLVIDTLFKAIYNKKNRGVVNVKDLGEIRNIELIDKIIDISQSPIGRTPRSNPATYAGCFTDIRNLYASLPEARARGYTNSRFSFNVKGGRCEACKGDGVIKVEMHFLPDVYVMCDQCHGKRFNRETQEIKFKDKSISDVLDMTIEECTKFFKNQPFHYKLSCLNRVGLGYITLGHKATALSGGEAQRVKLAKELSRKSTGNTLYILDEPTTGLHVDDIKKLLEILHILVEAGNSVIVIEHNMEVIKTADWIIDIGKEGGENGGNIIVEGPPEVVASCEDSYTGQYLKNYLVT